MKIGNVEAKRLEKKSGWLDIPGTDYKLPVTIICGGEGKTTLITGGIHNAEYVGIQAAIELSQEFQPMDMDGTLIIVPLVNVSGFSHRTMSLTYEDGKNLNREFPGKEDGSVSDKICATVVKELFSKADYYIDLHCGDGFEELTPYAYYVGSVDDKVCGTAIKMALCVDTPYIVESQCTTGGAYNYANAIGIPSILLERGCKGVWSREEVEQDKEDVKRILSMLYHKDMEKKKKYTSQKVFKEVVYEDAPMDGCWYPMKKAGDLFHSGDLLGEIRDFFGNVHFRYVASKDGVVLYQTHTLSIQKNSPMIAYGVL